MTGNIGIAAEAEVSEGNGTNDAENNLSWINPRSKEEKRLVASAGGVLQDRMFLGPREEIS